MRTVDLNKSIYCFYLFCFIYSFRIFQISSEDSLPNTVINNGQIPEAKPGESDGGRIFLDTNVMCNSPSANYYKPTDEPEPWDITQLNIEASVMCLVSKVKFLCGRCGSPAVRLKQTSRGTKKIVITDQPIGSSIINKEADAVSKAVNKVVRNGE